MTNRAGKPYFRHRDLMLRLGLLPPDTEFNRRADEYAKYSVKLIRQGRYEKAKRTKKALDSV